MSVNLFLFLFSCFLLFFFSFLTCPILILFCLPLLRKLCGKIFIPQKISANEDTNFLTFVMTLSINHPLKIWRKHNSCFCSFCHQSKYQNISIFILYKLYVWCRNRKVVIKIRNSYTVGKNISLNVYETFRHFQCNILREKNCVTNWKIVWSEKKVDIIFQDKFSYCFHLPYPLLHHHL